MVHSVLLRDGSVEAFNIDKIISGIWDAVRDVGGHDKQRVKVLAQLVSMRLDERFGEYGIPSITDVEQIVEEVLIKEGHDSVSRAYILARKRRDDLLLLRSHGQGRDLVSSYVMQSTDSPRSFIDLDRHIVRNVMNDYLTTNVYSPQILDLHSSGDLFIHELDRLSVYRATWDLQDILRVGIRSSDGSTLSIAPKHFRVALGQIASFLHAVNHEVSARHIIYHLDTLLSPFVRYDNLTYSDVLQAIEEFLFMLSSLRRHSLYVPELLFGMDVECPTNLSDSHVIVAGSVQTEVYSDFAVERSWIGKAFCSCLSRMIDKQQIFSPPCLLLHLTKDSLFSHAHYLPFFSASARYGFIDFVRDGDITECFGSTGKITINLPRIALVATHSDDFFARLDMLLSSACQALSGHRKIIEDFSHSGMFSYSSFYLRSFVRRMGLFWGKHVSSIGVAGLHEAIMFFLKGEAISSSAGIEFSQRLLSFIRERLALYSDEFSCSFSLEPTYDPSVLSYFSSIDRERFGRLLSDYSSHEFSYTPGASLPAHYSGDVFTAINLQEPLQSYFDYDSLFDSESLQELSCDDVALVVERFMKETSLSSFRFTPSFFVCTVHGYVSGDYTYCPYCVDEQTALESVAEEERELKRIAEIDNESLNERQLEEDNEGVVVVKKKGEDMLDALR